MSVSKEEKKKALLQAASDVFLEYGPRRTRLEDIAKRAGMAKTSLYYYFRDKDDIIRTIVKKDMARLHEIMIGAVDSADTAEGKILALSEARYQFIADKASRANKEIVSEFRSLAGVFEAEKETYLHAQKDLIEGILKEGIEKGEIRPIKDLDLLALTMIASMFGCDNTFAFYDQRESVMEAIKQMVRIFFIGLRNAP